MDSLRVETRWNGTVDGFNYEIVNWDRSSKWNYYLFFFEKNTSKKLFDELLKMPKGKYSIRYDDTWLANLDWHYGITYCEFLYGSDGNIYGVKAGCDYSHYYDGENKYCLEDIHRDAINTIKNAKEYIDAMNAINGSENE